MRCTVLFLPAFLLVAFAQAEDTAKPITLEELAGKAGEKGRKCILVKLDGKETKKEYRLIRKGAKLVLESKHKWEDGEFEAASGKLTFNKKPSFDEMPEQTNEDPPKPIPPWARLQVDGSLKWKLELTAKWKPNKDPGSAPTADAGAKPMEYGRIILEGKWYPGRIKWEQKDNKNRAWVPEGDEGLGRPVAVEYHVIPDEYKMVELDLQLADTSKARKDREESQARLKTAQDEAQKKFDAIDKELHEKEDRLARLKESLEEAGKALKHAQEMAESDAQIELPAITLARDSAGKALLKAMYGLGEKKMRERIANLKKNTGLPPNAPLGDLVKTLPADSDIRKLHEQEQEERAKLLKAEAELAAAQAKFEKKRGVEELARKRAELAKRLDASAEELEEFQAGEVAAAAKALAQAYQASLESAADLQMATDKAKSPLRIYEVRVEVKERPVYGVRFEKMNEISIQLERETAHQKKLEGKLAEYEGYRKKYQEEMKTRQREIGNAVPGTFLGIQASDWAQLGIDLAADVGEVFWEHRKGGPVGATAEFGKKVVEKAIKWARTGTTYDFYDPWEKALFQQFLDNLWQNTASDFVRGTVGTGLEKPIALRAEKAGWQAAARVAEDFEALEAAWDRYKVFEKRLEEAKALTAKGLAANAAKNIGLEILKDLGVNAAKTKVAEWIDAEKIGQHLQATKAFFDALKASENARAIYVDTEKLYLKTLKEITDMRQRLQKQQEQKVLVQEAFRDGDELKVELLPTPDPDPVAATRKLKLRAGGRELHRLAPLEKYLARGKMEDLEHDRQGGVKLSVEIDLEEPAVPKAENPPKPK